MHPADGQDLGTCNELYLYDDRDGSIECVSCDHDGTTTHSFGTPTAPEPIDSKLSADGTTAAFATQEALLARRRQRATPTSTNGETAPCT